MHLPVWGGTVALHLTPGRQRVPMLSASTLEDRTRPALDGTAAARLRYFSWPHWHEDEFHPWHESRPTQVRLSLGQRRHRRRHRRGL
jgi:hypothetical protein